LLRIGACADELHLMGCECGSTLAEVVVAVEASASLARKASSAYVPPYIKWMWRGPCGEGSNYTVHIIGRGGRRRARRCARSRRFAVTKGCSELEGTVGGRYYIEA